MDSTVSYSISLKVKTLVGSTPASSIQEDVNFLEQAIGNNLIDTRLAKVVTQIPASGTRSINLSESNFSYIKTLLIKSSQLIKIEIDTLIPANTETIKAKSFFKDTGIIVPTPTRITNAPTQPVVTADLVIRLTNLTTIESEVTLIAVGY